MGQGPDETGTVVLVADDEESVLKFISAALGRSGHTVLTALDGLEAVALVRERPDIQLVLLDLTMPGMDGAEALREIRGIRPELPIVLSSGFISDASGIPLGGEQPNAFLQKPYRRDALLQLIQDFAREDDPQ